ncbi:MAG: cobyrinate a,c-diamide synthase [Pseudomonadota bacterium]|nr:cobyrinate a,c-diamide synthase [Pseudomonadota bacterium]
MIPTVLVAAPSSGSGKTTVVCALAAALRARGLDVRTFKAGPDYLDPTWHRVVTGRTSRNLDGWMTGRDGVLASFARGAPGGKDGGDIALIEGVMGLFDGRSPRSLEGSGAELAKWLNVPVVVVVDAGGMARTAAAVVAGLAGYEPGVDVTGVIFNRVGSPGHGSLLAEAMETVPSVRCIGSLGRREDLAVPERHLGLVTGDTAARPGWAEDLAAWAGALDLDALLAMARVPVVPAFSPPSAVGRVRIGLAHDAAFHFYYEDNLDLLREAGAELVPFSPLADSALPADLDGLYLGGGYPEEHRDVLSANVSMRHAIRAFPGMIYAECGGLMYLGDTLDGAPMCQVLPVQTRMTGRLRTLGYREVTTTAATPLGPAGTVFRGHEFHYSELAAPPALTPAFRMTGRGGEGVEGWAKGNVLGSYVHAHFGSNPALATNLVAACKR